MKYDFQTHADCNEVDRYGKKEAGTGEHLRHFNNKINNYKWKAAAPHGRLPHTKHKLKSRPGPLSSSTVVTPHLTLPKLLRGTRDRWVAQVSFITIYSTGLAPFPRLSAPPHSPHWWKQNDRADWHLQSAPFRKRAFSLYYCKICFGEIHTNKICFVWHKRLVNGLGKIWCVTWYYIHALQ